jgi:hypothetical protein
MIHSHTQKEFEQHIYPGCKVIELGDQLMDVGQDTQFMRSDEYYKDKANITSVDWHGKNRALKLDLSTELKEELQGDILTDFGTIEHVSDLYNALLNAHNFTKEGGTMIHANPKTGTYAGHGHHFFTQDFWNAVGNICNYEVLDVYEKRPYSDENTDIEVYAVFKKGKAKFPTREVFEKATKGKVLNK